MSGPAPPRLAASEGARRAWVGVEGSRHGLDPESALVLFERAGQALARRPGRGEVRRVDLPGGGSALIRCIRRGGALRGVLPDVFLGARRSLAELAAADRLAPLGVAPPVLAVEAGATAVPGCVRLRVAVLEVPESVDVLRLADAAPDAVSDLGLARLAGRAVRAMHDAGVAHADLNAANLLVSSDAQGRRVQVVDLDKAVVGDGPVAPGRRVRDVLRLCRSIDKWAATASLGAFERRAFLGEALPPPLARRALARARRRAVRSRRVPRPGFGG